MANEDNAQDERIAVLQDLGNRVARSTVAVIDTVVQRGGFKGEELSTIGQLRDQAIEVIQLVEQPQETNKCLKNYVPDVVHHMRERDENGDFQWVRRMTSELFGGKKVLLFGLPGAFTPTCTNEQLPTYEEMYDKFIDMGFDEVWCTSVNDAFSMFQWAKMLGIEKVVT